MYERFNFYDVYAYLFPGLAAIALFGAPFFVARRSWPQTELLSTIAVLLASYGVGHVLAEAGRGVPFLRERVMPSVRLVRDGGLSPELKAVISEALQARLGLNLATASDPQIQDGFYFARNVAMQEGKAGYFEQFQGLYGLMRGLSVTLSLAAAAYLGWGLAAVRQVQAEPLYRPMVGLIALFVIAFALAVTSRMVQRTKIEKKYKDRLERTHEWGFAVVLMISSFAFGWVGATHAPARVGEGWVLLCCAAAAALFAARFSRSYKEQTMNFARAVYLAFAAVSSSKSDRNA